MPYIYDEGGNRVWVDNIYADRHQQIINSYQEGYVPSDRDGSFWGNAIDSVQASLYGMGSDLASYGEGTANELGLTSVANALHGVGEWADEGVAINANRNQYTNGFKRFLDPGYYVDPDGLVSDTGSMVGSMLPMLAVAAATKGAGGGLLGAMGKTALGRVGARATMSLGEAMATNAGKTALMRGVAKIAGDSALGRAIATGVADNISVALGPAITNGLLSGVGLIAGGLTENAANAGEVYRSALEQGDDQQTAIQKMNQNFSDGVLPSIADFAIEKAGLKGSLGAWASKGGNVAKRVMKGAVTNALVEAPAEAGIEAWQTYLQQKAVNPDSVDGVNLDPSTWTDDMLNSSASAFGGSLLIGGVGGAKEGLFGKTNQVATDNGNLGDSNIGELTSSQTSPVDTMPDITVDDSDAIDVTGVNDQSYNPVNNPENDEIFRYMDTFKLNNNNTAPSADEIATYQQGANDIINNAYAQYANANAEELANIPDNQFTENFKNLGFTDAQSNVLSTKLKENVVKYQTQKGVVDNTATTSQATQVQSSDNTNQVTPTKYPNAGETQAQLQKEPSQAKNNAKVSNATQAQQEVAVQQEQATSQNNEKAPVRQKRDTSATEVPNKTQITDEMVAAHERSINKPFFDNVIQTHNPTEASRRFSQAMAKQKQDVEAGKEPKVTNRVTTYLNAVGLNEKNGYSKDEVDALSKYAQRMRDFSDKNIQANAERDEARAKLMNRSRELADFENKDRALANMISNAKTKTDKANVFNTIRNEIKPMLGKGISLSSMKTYKALDAKDSQAKALRDELVRMNQQALKPAEHISDEKYAQVKEHVNKQKKVSISSLRKDLQLTNREANDALDKLESEGIISPKNGAKPRDVLANKTEKTKKKDTPKTHKTESYQAKAAKAVSDVVNEKTTKEDAVKELERMAEQDYTDPQIKKHIKAVADSLKYLDVTDENRNNNIASNKNDLEKLKEIQKDHKELKSKHDNKEITPSEARTELSFILGRMNSLSDKYPKLKPAILSLMFRIKSFNRGDIDKWLKNPDNKLPSHITNAILERKDGGRKEIFKWLKTEFQFNSNKLDENLFKNVLIKFLNEQLDTIVKLSNVKGITQNNSDKVVASLIDSGKAEEIKLGRLAVRIAGMFNANYPNQGEKLGQASREAMFPNSKDLSKHKIERKDQLYELAKAYFRKFDKVKARNKIATKSQGAVMTMPKMETFPTSQGDVNAKGSFEIIAPNEPGKLQIKGTIEFAQSLPSKNTYDVIKQVAQSMADNVFSDMYADGDAEIMSTERIDDSHAEVIYQTDPLFYEAVDTNALSSNKVELFKKALKAALEQAKQNKEDGIFGYNSLYFDMPQTKDTTFKTDLQKLVNEMYNEGEYIVSEMPSDNEGKTSVIIHEPGMELDEDTTSESTFFSTGTEDNTVKDSNIDKYDKAIVDEMIDAVDDEIALDKGLSEKILSSIKHFTSDESYKAIVNYLHEAKHLKFADMSKSKFNGMGNGVTSIVDGIIYIDPKAFKNNPSVVIHELFHDIVGNMTLTKALGGELSKLEKYYISKLEDIIKDGIKRVMDRSGNNEQRTKQGISSSVSEREESSTRSNTGFTSTDGIRNQGSNQASVERRTGDNRGNRSVYKTDSSRSIHDSSNETGSGQSRSGSNELAGRELGKNGVDERGRTVRGNPVQNAQKSSQTSNQQLWSNLSERIRQINSLSKVKNFTREITADLYDIINDDMDMNDKIDAILLHLHALDEVSRRLGLDSDKNLLTKMLHENYKVLQETIAYLSHTKMSAKQQADILRLNSMAFYSKTSAPEFKNLPTRQARFNLSHSVLEKAFYHRRVGLEGLQSLIKNKAIKYSSTALQFIKDIQQNDIYGPIIISLKHERVFSRPFNVGTVDIYSADYGMKEVKEAKNDEELHKIHTINDSRALTSYPSDIFFNAKIMIADEPKTASEMKESLRKRKNTPGVSSSDKKLVIQLIKRYFIPQDSPVQNFNDMDIQNYISGNIDENKNILRDEDNQIPTYAKNNLRNAFLQSFRHYSKTGNRNFKSVYEEYAGKPLTNQQEAAINKMIDIFSKYNIVTDVMVEVKALEDIVQDDVDTLYVDKKVLEKYYKKDEKKIRLLLKEAEKLGYRVIDVESSETNSLENIIGNDALERGMLLQKGSQSGPEAGDNFLKSLVNKLNSGRKTGIEVLDKSQAKGHIKGFPFKRLFSSPSRLLEAAYGERARVLIDANKKAKVTEHKLTEEYGKELDSIYGSLNEKDRDNLDKVIRDVSDRGREYFQPYQFEIMNGGKRQQLSVIAGYKDTVHEYTNSVDAQKQVEELKSKGFNTFSAYRDGKFYVISSKDKIKAFDSRDKAFVYAAKASKAAIVSSGLSENVAEQYIRYRRLLDRIQYDKAVATNGLEELGKTKYLFGYSPMIHRRYGVYKEATVDGQSIYTCVDSFDTKAAAIKYAKERVKDTNEKLSVRYRQDIFKQEYLNNTEVKDYDQYYGAMDSETFAGMDELFNTSGNITEDPRQTEKRFMNTFPEMAKLVSKVSKKGMPIDKFNELLHNNALLREVGIDKTKLAKEISDANLTMYFNKNKVVKRDTLKEHLLLGIRTAPKDKFNRTRTNAEGASKDVRKNTYEYIRYSARYISRVNYSKVSSAWEYEYFGERLNNDNLWSDERKLVSDYNSIILGKPNGWDNLINRLINELPFVGDFITSKYGETFATDLIRHTTAATAYMKLGLWNVTSALSQLGSLANVYTEFGNTPEFRKAWKYSYNRKNTPAIYQELFDYVDTDAARQGVNFEYAREAKNIAESKLFGFPIGKYLEKSLAGFIYTDSFVRRVATITAYETMKNDPKYKMLDGSIDKERLFSDVDASVRKTAFDFTSSDEAGIFRMFGAAGKMLLQFKKYPLKQMEYIYDVVTSGDRAKQTRFLVSYGLMSGLFGLPFMGMFEEPKDWIQKKALAMAGKDKASQMAVLTLLYGAPSIAGVNFSGNVGLADLIPNSKQQILGPTIGTIVNTVSAFSSHQGANTAILSMLKEISPMTARLYQGYTGNARDWKNGVDTYKYSPYERALKMLGFMPMREYMDNQLSYQLSKESTEFSTAKRQIINAYIDGNINIKSSDLKKYGITTKELKEAKEKAKQDRLDKQVGRVNKTNKSETAADIRRTAEIYSNFMK